MSVISESEQAGKIRWQLCLDVAIDGIELPFRLRCATDDHDAILEALADFHAMLSEVIWEKLE